MLTQLELTPYFLLRLCGEPTQGLDALRFEKMRAYFTQLEEKHRRLFAKSEQLCDVIFERVLKFESPIQKQLINLKRKIFNLKKIKKLQELELTFKQICPDIWDQILHWDKDLEDYHHFIRHGESLLDEEIEEKRSILKNMFACPDFQKGLLASSRVIFNSCREYIETDRMKKKHFKMEHKLLLYYLRYASKTSPFSTFTTVSKGQFDAPKKLKSGDMEKQSSVALNITILETLLKAVHAHASARKNLVLALNNTLVFREPYYYYLRVFDHFLVQRGNMKNAELFKVHQTESMDLLVERLGNRQIPFASLTEELAEVVSGDQEDIEAVLEQLLEIDFLVVKDPFADLVHEPFNRLRSNITHSESEELLPLLEEVDLLEKYVDEYPKATLQGREEILEALAETVNRCYQILDLEEETWDTYIFEDTTLAKEDVALPHALFEPFLDDLAPIHKLGQLFSTNLIDSLNMAGYYNHHFEGRDDVPFLEFYDAYYKDFYLMHGLETLKEETIPNPFNLQEIDTLNALRQELFDAVNQQEPTEGSVHLNAGFVQDLLNRIPEDLRLPTSKSFYVQIEPNDDNPLLVINHIYPGRGNAFTRFTKLFADEEEVCKSVEKRLADDAENRGAVFAELSTNFASNLNIHKRLVNMEILLPSEQGFPNGEMDRSLELKNMHVRVDQGRLEIFAPEIDSTVLPLYLGTLYPPFLGDIYRIVNALSDNDFALLDFPMPEVDELLKQDETEIKDRVVFVPRVQYQNIVLRRASWHVALGSFPQRRKSESAYDFYLRVRTWFRVRELPTRCFFRFPSKKGRKSKPNYMDLHSYFTVSAFIRDMGASAYKTIEFTELLPTKQIVESEKGPMVSEVVLETTLRSWD